MPSTASKTGWYEFVVTSTQKEGTPNTGASRIYGFEHRFRASTFKTTEERIGVEATSFDEAAERLKRVRPEDFETAQFCERFATNAQLDPVDPVEATPEAVKEIDGWCRECKTVVWHGDPLAVVTRTADVYCSKHVL